MYPARNHFGALDILKVLATTKQSMSNTCSSWV